MHKYHYWVRGHMTSTWSGYILWNTDYIGAVKLDISTIHIFWPTCRTETESILCSHKAILILLLSLLLWVASNKCLIHSKHFNCKKNGVFSLFWINIFVLQFSERIIKMFVDSTESLISFLSFRFSLTEAFSRALKGPISALTTGSHDIVTVYFIHILLCDKTTGPSNTRQTLRCAFPRSSNK